MKWYIHEQYTLTCRLLIGWFRVATTYQYNSRNVVPYKRKEEEESESKREKLRKIEREGKLCFQTQIYGVEYEYIICGQVR